MAGDQRVPADRSPFVFAGLLLLFVGAVAAFVGILLMAIAQLPGPQGLITPQARVLPLATLVSGVIAIAAGLVLLRASKRRGPQAPDEPDGL